MKLRYNLIQELAISGELCVPEKISEQRFAVGLVYPKAQDSTDPYHNEDAGEVHAAIITSWEIQRLNSILLCDDQLHFNDIWLRDRCHTVLTSQILALKSKFEAHLRTEEEIKIITEKVLNHLNNLKILVNSNLKKRSTTWRLLILKENESEKTLKTSDTLLCSKTLHDMSKSGLFNLLSKYPSLYLMAQIRMAIGYIRKSKKMLTIESSSDLKPLSDLRIVTDGTTLILHMWSCFAHINPPRLEELRSMMVEACTNKTKLDLSSWTRVLKEEQSHDEMSQLIGYDELITISETLFNKGLYTWRELISYICTILLPVVTRYLSATANAFSVQGEEYPVFPQSHDCLDICVAGYKIYDFSICASCLEIVPKSGLQEDENNKKSSHRCAVFGSDATILKYSDIVDEGDKYLYKIIRNAQCVTESTYITDTYLNYCSKLFDLISHESVEVPDVTRLLDNNFPQEYYQATGFDVDRKGGSSIWRPCFGPPPKELLTVLYGLCLYWPHFMEMLLMHCTTCRISEQALGYPLPDDHKFYDPLVVPTDTNRSIDTRFKQYIKMHPEILLDLPMSEEFGNGLLPPELQGDVTESECITYLKRSGEGADKLKGPHLIKKKVHKDKSWISRNHNEKLYLNWRIKLVLLLQPAFFTDYAGYDPNALSPCWMTFNRKAKLIEANPFASYGIDWSVWAINSATEKSDKDVFKLVEDYTFDDFCAHRSKNAQSNNVPMLLVIGGLIEQVWRNSLFRSIPEDEHIWELLDERGGIIPDPIRKRLSKTQVSFGFEMNFRNVLDYISRSPCQMISSVGELADGKQIEKLSKVIPPFSREPYDNRNRDGAENVLSLYQSGASNVNRWLLDRLHPPQVLIIIPKRPTNKTNQSRFSYASLEANTLKYYIDTTFEIKTLIIEEGSNQLRVARELIVRLNGFIITVRKEQIVPINQTESKNIVTFRVQFGKSQDICLTGAEAVETLRNHMNSYLCKDG